MIVLLPLLAICYINWQDLVDTEGTFRFNNPYQVHLLLERLFAVLLSVSNVNFSKCDMACLLYTSPSPRDGLLSRMPSSA